jgi:hypothetical protein
MIYYLANLWVSVVLEKNEVNRGGGSMKIEIGWFSENAELSSTKVVGEISQEYSIPLIPAYTADKKFQSLTWEVDSLDTQLSNPASTLEFRTVAHILCLIECDLREKGVRASITIDGFSVLHYASKQETEVKKVWSRVKEARFWLNRSLFRTNVIKKALRALE